MTADPIRLEALRTFRVQMRRSSALATLIVTAYTVATTWSFTARPAIAAWLAVQGANQIWRTLLLRDRGDDRGDEAALVGWARRYTLHMAASGLVWGATPFLFMHPAQPITVALTLCVLYAITAGVVPGQAYHPPAFYALAVPIFAAVLIRLGATGSFPYVMLGLGSAGFALVMAGFCRVQERVLAEGFAIRFEREALLAARGEQTAAAEAARRQAEAASLAKTQFLAAASHDLRQPLYAMTLFSASLEQLRLDDEARAVVADIQASIGVMESLFAALLDLTRLEAGTVEARPVPVSIDALFDRLSQYNHPIAVERGLDLRLRSDGEWVTSDPALLEQLLANLVANALRYTAVGGVLVAARRRGGGVSLEVWDTGPGIGAADRERIFDEFVQLGNRERDRRKGLGLGLSIVRRAAALLGTDVTLASRPGIGSRFAIVQPVAAPATVPARTTGAATPPPAIERAPVLLIDDDAAVRSALTRLFAAWGVAATAVASAEEALRLIGIGERFGLVLADYRLGGSFDGLELLGLIADRCRDARPARALVTGDVEPALLAAARSRDIAVLHKPVSPAALRDLLGLAPLAGRPVFTPL